MIKIDFKINRIYVVTILITSIATVVILYLMFYKPLVDNRELFPDRASVGNYSVKEEISESDKKQYGISFDSIKNYKNQVYLIDGREKEEYEKAHFEGSINIRVPDINSIDDISEALGIETRALDDALIVFYCHDGTRSAEVASRLSSNNIKFLLEGRKNFSRPDVKYYGDINLAPFSDRIQSKNFTIQPEDAIKLLKKGAFLIDGRLYNKDISFSRAKLFRIGQLSSRQYEIEVKEIISNSHKDIIFIANVYPDLFYAKLLAHRLEINNNFDINKLHIVFGQDKHLYDIIKKAGML